MSKEIWIPSSETSVRVTQDGNVTVWDDMKMTLKQIPQPTGFTQGGTMTTYRDRHHAGLTSSDPDKRAKAEAKLTAAEKTAASKTKPKK